MTLGDLHSEEVFKRADKALNQAKANERKHCYIKAEAIQLQCLAHWIALNIRYFKRQTQCFGFA